MNRPQLYPLTFRTIYKDKIWGGDKISSYLHKEYAPLPNCGETWEVSAVEGDVSVVANGPLQDWGLDQLLADYKAELIGEANYQRFGTTFPLLIKFIDAQQDLSVQVHPDDVMAKKYHGPDAHGKTEMWYIMQADEDSSLIVGFSEKIQKNEFMALVEEANLEKVLNREPVNAGDVFYIPAGRVHTIGKGILLAEIQQTSDYTYRIYDFDRTDSKGNKRELHVDKAVEALDFTLYDRYRTAYEQIPDQRNTLVASPFFKTNTWVVTKKLELNYRALDSFVLLIVVEGEVDISFNDTIYGLKMGDVVLIPAVCEVLSVQPKSTAKLLEVYID